MRGAGGSRTRFRGFADRRPAVRLRRPRNVDPLPLSRRPCPRQESNLVFGLRKVVCESGTLRGQSNRSEQDRREPPTRESNPALRLRTPPCVRHTRGETAECPRQESNLVFDLRKVACRPSHAEGGVEADGRTRTGMNPLTRRGPHRSATSAASRGARSRTLSASFGGSLLSQEHTPEDRPGTSRTILTRARFAVRVSGGG